MELEQGVICLLEQESVLAREIRRAWLGEESIGIAKATRHPAQLASHAALLGELTSGTKIENPLDPRITTALSWIEDMEARELWPEISLDTMLPSIALSASRFLHLFSQEMGTPWRTYLTWRRALAAASLALEGAPLTRAAHEVGYTDSAHLSRQFVRLFGFPPAAITKSSQFVQV